MPLENRKASKPWWESGLIVTILGSFIPIASFLQGYLHKERELELQRQRQFSELRISYANLMLEGGVERVELLADFIAQTESDPEIRRWAGNQHRVAESQRKRVQEELEAQQKKLAEADNKVRELMAQAEAAKKQAEAATAAQREAAAKEAEMKLAQLREAEAKAAVAESYVLTSREVLKGRPVPIQQVAPQAQQTINRATLRGLNLKQ